MEAFDLRLKESAVSETGPYGSKSGPSGATPKETLHLTSNSFMIESSAQHLKERLQKYKDKIPLALAAFEKDDTFNSRTHGATKLIEYGRVLNKSEQQTPQGHHVRAMTCEKSAIAAAQLPDTSHVYSDSLRDAIEVIIKKLDEKIELSQKLSKSTRSGPKQLRRCKLRAVSGEPPKAQTPMVPVRLLS